MENPQTPFWKYPSLVNHYKKREVSYVLQHANKVDPVIVYEKLHGSNIAIFMDIKNKTVKVASRNGFIDNFSNFYGTHELFSDIVSGLEGIILDIWEYGKEDNPPLLDALIVLRGELVGNSVQKEVKYFPTENPIKMLALFAVEFYRWRGDTQLESSPNNQDERTILVGKGVEAFVNELHTGIYAVSGSGGNPFKNITVCPYTTVNSWQEALAMEADIPSTFARQNQPFAIGVDHQEGFVFISANPSNNPLEVVELDSGVTVVRHSLLAIKHKTESFSERKGVKRVQPLERVPETFSPELTYTLWVWEEHVTESRLSALLSKESDVSGDALNKNFSRLLRDLREDIVKDLEDVALPLLVKADNNVLGKKVGKLLSTALRNAVDLRC